jgi:hypothetical protein
MTYNIIDINPLLQYFEILSNAMETIYPEEITWNNCSQYNYKLDYKHPEWVQKHFPLNLIYYRQDAGKLRNSKKAKIKFQNSVNVLTQLIASADDFGIHYRKNKHKGFKTIVGAIKEDTDSVNGRYGDKIKPNKYRDYSEFYRCEYAGNIPIKALTEILDEHYKSNSKGQLKLL